MSRHELFERGLGVLAAFAHLDQAVELGEHVLESRHVLGRHVPHAFGHLPEVGAHHLLADVLLQLVEHALCDIVDESILAQLADPPGGVGRKRIEERLSRARVVVITEAQLRALPLQDLLHAFPDVLQRAGEIEQRLLSIALLPQALPKGLHAREAAPHAPPEQPLQRVVGASTHQDLVGELLEHVGGRHVGTERILGAVPPRVAEVHATSVRASPSKAERSAADREVPPFVTRDVHAKHASSGLCSSVGSHTWTSRDIPREIGDLHEPHTRGIDGRTSDRLGEAEDGHHLLGYRG